MKWWNNPDMWFTAMLLVIGGSCATCEFARAGKYEADVAHHPPAECGRP